MTGAEFRALCRTGEFDRPTAGVALGYAQVNLVILRAEAAKEFEDFCRANPKPCPLLEMTATGDYEPQRLAPGSDVRTDLPRYRVLRNGECIDRPTSIIAYWPDAISPSPFQGEGRGEGLIAGLTPHPTLSPQGERGSQAGSDERDADFVAFLIGCSFTFETALLKAGIPMRHIAEGRNVPMYRTNRACTPAGRFHGPMVVSMRPMTPEHAKLATRITAAFPRVHGAPIHIGDPTAIGIPDVNRPDYGDAVSIHPGEIPVFWACGVTPLEVILRARLDIAIVHEPGHMLVTDVSDESLREDPRGGAA
jgi:uncharacterized protein YcsI (UPF0317 family)